MISVKVIAFGTKTKTGFEEFPFIANEVQRSENKTDVNITLFISVVILPSIWGNEDTFNGIDVRALYEVVIRCNKVSSVSSHEMVRLHREAYSDSVNASLDSLNVVFDYELCATRENTNFRADGLIDHLLK